MARFNRADTNDLKNARAVLRNPTSNTEEKSAAEKTITRIQTERTRRIEARRSAGEQPQRKDFESDDAYKTALHEYWAKLDQAVATRDAFKILNDPSSSVLLRTRAYERLGMKPPETPRSDESKAKRSDRAPTRDDFGHWSGEDWENFVASGKEARYQAALEQFRETAPPLSPGDQKFLDDLDATITARKEKEKQS